MVRPNTLAQGDLVRRIPLGIGVALVLVGVIIVTVASQLTGQTEYQRVAGPREDLPYGEWSIAAEFRAGTRFFVGFAGPELEGVPDGEPILFINITDPTGGNTTLRIHVRTNIVTKYPGFNITVVATSDGFDAPQPTGNYNDAPIDFGGVTKIDGSHTAYMYTYSQALASFYYPPDAELPRLELYEIVNMTPPVVQYAVVGGAAVSLIGVVLSVWAAKSQKRPKRGRQRR
jgi:hypothetical protein